MNRYDYLFWCFFTLCTFNVFLAGCANLKAGLDALVGKLPAAAVDAGAGNPYALLYAGLELVAAFVGGAVSYHGVQAMRGKRWIDKNADGLVSPDELADDAVMAPK
jgi:hypothetical protein